VVGLPPGEQRRIAELLIGDHREQCLWQVVVDVRVHAEQDMAERGQAGRGVKRDVPGPCRAASRQRGLEGVQVQVGERDVPPLHPLGVSEAATPQFPGYGCRRALVGGVEILPLIAGGLQRFEQGRHPDDQLLHHAAIIAECANGNTIATRLFLSLDDDAVAIASRTHG
jgi:hypothetical protein